MSLWRSLGNIVKSTAAGQFLFGNSSGGYAHTETSEMQWNDADKQLILGMYNTPLKPALAFGDGDTGFYQKADNTIRVSIAGNARWKFYSAFFSGNSEGGYITALAATGILPAMGPNLDDDDTGVGSAAADQLSLIAGGVEGARITETASAITAEIFGDIVGNVSKIITVSTATDTLNESSNYPEIILHVTRTTTGTCAITIDTDQLSNDSQITIKDAGGGAEAYPITIDTEGAETIDGAASVTIDSNYGSETLYTDGSNWFSKVIEQDVYDHNYAEMYMYEESTATVINVADQYHAIQGLFTQDHVKDFTMVAGSLGSGNITTAAAGAAINIADTTHGLISGDIVTVQSANHTGTETVTRVDDDNFTVVIAYVGDEACTWQEGDYLLAGTGSAGTYRFTYNMSLTSAGNGKTYKFELSKGETHIDESACERKIGTGADIGSMGANGFFDIAVGDRVFLIVKNPDDTTNLTLKHSNVSINRI